MVKEIKKYLVISFLIVFTFHLNVNAQDTISDPDYLEIPSDEINYINDVPNRSEKKQFRPNYRLMTGVSYTISPYRYAGPGYFISPSANVDATKRLNLSVGTGFSYQQLHNFSSDDASDLTPMMTYFIYTQGTYRISNRVIVDGSVAYARNDVPNPNKNNSETNLYQSDITSYSFGLTYVISPKVTFGVHFDFSNDPYNYYNYPNNYHNTMFNNLYAPYYKTRPFGYGYY